MKSLCPITFKRASILIFLLMCMLSAHDLMASDGMKKNLNVFIQSDHTERPKFLFTSPDRTILGSVGGHSDVKLWDISSNLLIKTIRIKQSFLVFTAALSQDNRLLATGGGDGVVRLWDVKTGALVYDVKDTKKSVTDIIFLKNGKTFVYAAEDSRVRVCDIKKREIIHTQYCDSFPNALAQRPENGHIMVGCFDGELLEYSSPEKGFRYQTMLFAHSKPVEDIAINPSGSRMVTTSQDNRARLWKRDASAKKGWTRMKTYKARDVSDSFNIALEGFFSADFSPKGDTFSFAGQDERLWICDSATGKISKRYRIKSPIASMAFTDSATLSVLKSGALKIQNYAIKTGKRSTVFSGSTLPVETLAVADDFLITVDGNQTAFVWRLPECSLITSFKAEHGCKNPFGRTVAISSDGSVYAITNGKKIDIVDGKTHRIKSSIGGNASHVSSIAFAPDKKHMAFLSGTETVVWNMAENKNVFREPTYIVDSICPVISPDSKTLVYAKSDVRLSMYDLEKSKERAELTLPSNVVTLAFSPDSLTLAAGCEDKKIRLLDGKTGAVKHTVAGQAGQIGYLFADIAWSPDGNTLASTDQSAGFLVWDTRSWTIKQSINTHFGNVNTLGFTKDGAYVISGGDDGSVRFNDLNTYETVISLFGLPHGQWAAISAKGYYNASEGGGEYINANSGLHVSTIDSYAASYFRPDLLPLMFSGKHTESFPSAAAETTPPVSRFRDAPLKSKTDTVTVSVLTTDAGGGIGKSVLYLNGSAIRTQTGRGLKKVSRGKTMVRSYEIKLNPGKNTLKVITFNKTNTVEGHPVYATIDYLASTPAKTNMLGLVIGIDQYRNPNFTLRYAAKDADLFAKTLSEKGQSLFSKINLTVLTRPSETSKQSILNALETFKDLSPNDLFVFYVAAHGVVDDGEYFLLTSDVGHLSSKKLAKDALSQSILKDIVSNIPTSKKLIVLDTCNSQALGNALETAFLTRGLSESTAIKLLARSTGSTILSASKTGQEAIEGYKDHGLFTYTLVHGLKGMADMNKDGFIKTTELADYVEEKVTELSETHFKKPQFPVVSRSGQSFPVSAN